MLTDYFLIRGNPLHPPNPRSIPILFAETLCGCRIRGLFRSSLPKPCRLPHPRSIPILFAETLSVAASFPRRGIMLCMMHGAGFPTPQFQPADRRTLLAAVLPQLDALYARYAEQHRVPGLIYGVLLDGELVHTWSQGTRRVGQDAPVDADTVFRIASMSKSFAALAVVMLRDAGKLRLDDPAADYAPELAQLAYPTRDSQPITVRQLLTMSAGWPEDDPWGDRQLAWRDDELVAHLAQGVAFSRAPGVAFEYSNLGYMALGRVIHGASGLSAPEYITRHILQPLGMTSTVWNQEEVAPERLALGYRWEENAWLPEPILPTGGDVGAFAGIFTTLRDLAKWVNLFLSAFPPRDDADNGIVQRSSLREMQQGWRLTGLYPQQENLAATPTVAGAAYGYGLFMRQDQQLASVGHSGGLPGYGSAMRWAPDYGLGLIALGNRTYAPMSAATLEGLLLAITAGKLPQRTLPPAPALLAAQEGVQRLLAAWDDDLADRLTAMNFFLDRSRESWRQEFAQVRDDHGDLQPEGAFEAENALSGHWRLRSARGWVDIWLALAPTLPPRIQALEITATVAPGRALTGAAAHLLRQVARPNRAALARRTAAGADLPGIWLQVQLANSQIGVCTLGKVVAGDGESTATWELDGGRRRARLALTLDAATGKIADAIFQPVWA
jgi:CubicO group peptidase (beta-lactamase class C family)